MDRVGRKGMGGSLKGVGGGLGEKHTHKYTFSHTHTNPLMSQFSFFSLFLCPPPRPPAQRKIRDKSRKKITIDFFSYFCLLSLLFFASCLDSLLLCFAFFLYYA